MARLSFRCGDELVAAVDVARGDVARERWLRRAVEQALESRRGSGLADAPKSLASEREIDTDAPTPAEQPESRPPAEEPQVLSRTEMFRRATQSREFRPYPKGGGG